MVHHINEKTILVIVFFVYAIEYVIRGEEPGGRDCRETVRWTVEQGAFEAGLNEAGERDRREPSGEAAGSPLWRTIKQRWVFTHLCFVYQSNSFSFGVKNSV